ncbi:MAG: ABC transporter ATP-binding protein [Candidatus Nanopelagicales bacterium]|nr:ABC transporter ATP-binding protein [Candidatus Nanopelagicales bacterium]
MSHDEDEMVIPQLADRVISEEIAVSVSDLDVTYRTTLEKRPTLKQAIVRMGRGKRSVRTIEALKDVTFEVPRGTVLGIVGHNGAGKSTLMRTIAGIVPPTRGRVEVTGRTSTLLSLGVGFNRALTGRENIVLGGLAAGLTKEELDERYEQIADFADIGDFIDMPMRSYSSGMGARLAFSVAVHLDPDILLIDEALSTGDAVFKEKAAQRMQELVDNSSTMLLISHALRTIINMSTEVIWLDHGKLMMQGDPEEVVDAYTEFVHVKKTTAAMNDM